MAAPDPARDSDCAAPEDGAFQPPPHQSRIFALILVGGFCGQLGLSIISPFFPKEAAEKSVSPGVLGWIFSIFELAAVVGTPVAMGLLVRIGSKPLLVAGNMLGGIGNIMLGFCWYIDDTAAFATCCFALRVLAGFSMAVAGTTGQALLPVLFGPSLSTAAGAVEGVAGLAMICGPIVGSLLFAVGGGEGKLGYILPFLVLGGIELIFSFANFVLLPSLPLPPAKRPSLSKFSWKVLLPFLNCIVNGISLGLLGPTLSPHLGAPPLEFSVSLVGFVFAAACASYALVSPAVGAFDDSTNARYAIQTMGFGNLVTGVGYGLAGPVPIRVNGAQLAFTPVFAWSSACLIGIGVAFGLIPVYKQILKHALHEAADERDLAASALFTVSMSSGAFLGPTLGGMVSQAIGIQMAYTYVSGILVALAFALIICSTLPVFRVETTTARERLLLNTS